jgi:hypothetical protein
MQAGHATKADQATAADRATDATNAENAAGALDQRIGAIEGTAVTIDRRATGWTNCQPLENFALDGGSNILIRASLWQDSGCTVNANDPHECHEFCAAQAFTRRTSAGGCCGVATYYTNGVVETLLIKPSATER